MDKLPPSSGYPKVQNYQVLRRVTESSLPPILTIAIPTYKRFGLLKETLNSVFSLRFLVPVEVIVVDNDPDNIELANHEMSDYLNNQLAYYKNAENLGMYGNWTQCLALARGRYVTILHDDDLLLPEFAVQINKLLRKESIPNEIIGFEIGLLDQRIDQPENISKDWPGLKSLLKKFIYLKFLPVVEKGPADLFFGNLFCGTLGVVMNRKMALSINGFNSDWYPVADYDFWCRWTTQFGNIQIYNKKVGLYRLQQNESLKPEVRIGFVTESTKLRQRLISQRAVPLFFKLLIRITASVQAKSVNLDWRAKDDADPIIFRIVLIRLWLLATKILGYLVRNFTNYKRKP
jgi:glycosyltransferase involved in cell wall biosynthesis